MSLGVRASRTLETAVNNAWSQGVVLVAAAGNGGNQTKIYPGAYPNVIAVAATDNKDAKASFSTYGASWVDIAAPGVNVYSTFPNHKFVLGTQNNRSLGYDVGNGTSMSSPIVAATAALVWSEILALAARRSAQRLNHRRRHFRHRHLLEIRPRERKQRREVARRGAVGCPAGMAAEAGHS